MANKNETNLFISEGVHPITSFRPACESFDDFVFYVSQRHHVVVHAEGVVDQIVDDPDAISDQDRVQYFDDSRYKLRLFPVQAVHPGSEKACAWNENENLENKRIEQLLKLSFKTN